MIQFKPYPSIGNHTDPEWMARVREAVPQGSLFAVQEKVDGANVSFLCDDLQVRLARRRAVLEPGEPFFRHEELLDRYAGHVYHVFNLLRLRYPGLVSIALYGELFGGGYPHPDVPALPGLKPVQQGTWYCPGYDFYAFDIYVFMKDGGFFLPVREAAALFSVAGLLYARDLYVGPLDACLAYPCAFPTLLPVELGLPPLEGNLCEGLVLKPLEPVFLPDGSRVAVKVKRDGNSCVRRCNGWPSVSSSPGRARG